MQPTTTDGAAYTKTRRRALYLAALALVAGGDHAALGQSAGIASSYALHEAARQQNIGTQIAWQDHVRWLAGLPKRQGGPAFPSLDYVYSGAWRGPSDWPTPYIFEPWPFVPGDLLGLPYAPSVPQPSGHQIVPTGPNGYIYRPLYGSPAVSPRVETSLPAVERALPPAQPGGNLGPEELPPPPAARTGRPSGLREF
jgi:hypothetical protein